MIKTEFYGSRLVFAGEETVSLERHNGCACDCRVKESDCHPNQAYLPHECRCMCRNTNSEHICNSRPDLHLWDPDRCLCVCKNRMECSTGMVFDPRECRYKSILNFVFSKFQRVSSSRNIKVQEKDEPSLPEFDRGAPERPPLNKTLQYRHFHNFTFAIDRFNITYCAAVLVGERVRYI